MALRNIGNNSEPEDIIRVANENFRLIDNQFRVNVVKQATGNAIVQGKLPYEGGYGSIYYDSSGLARIIIGIDPDGEVNIHASKEGVDILTLF